jgi:peptidoglycan/xylan/chitin deacetylase (PgdA/CDA1 family)
VADNNIIIKSWRDFVSAWSLRFRVRTLLRDVTVSAAALGRSMRNAPDGIRFPYYHHVFPDERRGFLRHLDVMGNFGDFISLDQAVEMLEFGERIDGRYFCITFDDGIRCCHDIATPILAERGIPAAFFIVTDYTADTDVGERRVCRPLHAGVSHRYEYLTWSECRDIVDAGMTIGSHTRSHVRLKNLNANEARRQLRESKRTIEEKLGTECRHFACPWGQPGHDFEVQRDVDTAAELGYRTFLTTQRGINLDGRSPFAICRDNMLASWGDAQLHYFLS